MDEQHQEQATAGGWVTLAEAARRLSRSERTIRQWLKEGRLPGHKTRVRGVEEWRVWLDLEAAPEDLEAVPVAAPGIAPEVFRELLARHEAASYRIGYLEAQLAGLPALTEGAAAAAARAAELEARAKDAERELLRAAALHAQERRRGRAWAVGAIVLALLVAVLVLASLLQRQPF